MPIHTRLRRGGAMLMIASSSGLMTGAALASKPSDLSSIRATAELRHSSTWHALATIPSKPAASVAATARGVTYAGSASTGEPVVIVLARDGKSIKRLTMQLDVPCSGGSSYAYDTNSSSKMTVSTSGKFAGAEMLEGDFGEGHSGFTTAIVDGKVTGKRLSGSATVRLDVSDATGAKVDTCERHATFKARSARRAVFGGQTSQGLPVVIELNTTRKAVRIFRIGSQAPCAPSGSIQDHDTLVNFPIRSGRFGDDWTHKPSDPTRAQDHYDYSLRGKIKRAGASGTFSVKWEQADETGALNACDTGPLTYSAKSG